MATRIQLRRGTAQQWNTSNPVLSEGEIGIETDTLKFKIGNGLNWNSIVQYANVVPSNLNTTLQDYLLVADLGTPSGPAQLDGSQNLLIPNDTIIFEGATEDSYQLALQAIDPTADRTISLPDKNGTVALTSDITENNANIGIKTNNLESTVTGIESTTTIDTASDSDWRTLKYLVQMTYSGEVHSAEILLANDGTNLLISQYGHVFSNAELATITADKIGGIINLKVTPVSGKTPLSVRFFRTGIKA